MKQEHIIAIENAFKETANNYARLAEFAPQVVAISNKIIANIEKGGTVLFVGNGGSASDALHLSAELQGRFLHDRKPLPAIALTANIASITAIGNDYAYDTIFSRQVMGYPSPNNILIGLSTSGNSKNILKAFEVAQEIGMYCVGLTGENGGQMSTLCDDCIRVPSDHTPRIQEMHIGVGHSICELIEQHFMNKED